MSHFSLTATSLTTSRTPKPTHWPYFNGNVNHKSLFDSVIRKHFNGVKIGICGLHYHPNDPLAFSGGIKNLFFYHSSLCAFFLIHLLISLQSQTGHIDYYNITTVQISYNLNAYCVCICAFACKRVGLLSTAFKRVCLSYINHTSYSLILYLNCNETT